MELKFNHHQLIGLALNVLLIWLLGVSLAFQFIDGEDYP